MKRHTALAALLAALAALSAAADELVLKSGTKYAGTITRSKPGEVCVTTATGNQFFFKDDAVSFRLCKYTEPAEARQAVALLNARKYAEAKPLFAKMEQRFRDLPAIWYDEALYGVGVCAIKLGEHDEGIASLTKLVEMFPESRHRNEAEVMMIDAQLSDASGPGAEAKLEALLKDPRSSNRVRAKAQQGLATICEQKNDTKGALERYANIVVLYGDVEELQKTATQKCADLFLALGRTNEARFYFGQLVESYAGALSPEELGRAKAQAAALEKAAKQP